MSSATKKYSNLIALTKTNNLYGGSVQRMLALYEGAGIVDALASLNDAADVHPSIVPLLEILLRRFGDPDCPVDTSVFSNGVFATNLDDAEEASSSDFLRPGERGVRQRDQGMREGVGGGGDGGGYDGYPPARGMMTIGRDEGQMDMDSPEEDVMADDGDTQMRDSDDGDSWGVPMQQGGSMGWGQGRPAWSNGWY